MCEFDAVDLKDFEKPDKSISLEKFIHKGDAGRILVVGGSIEYSGAPYFAAMASLKCGADLAYVICAEEAAVSIKSYSPDLIVFPFLSSSCSESVDLELVRSVIKRANVIIIGPGLSRNNHIQHTAVKIILESQSMKKQLIIDGDAIFLLSMNPSVIKPNNLIIITPNHREFNLLKECAGCSTSCLEECLMKISAYFKNSVIVLKGKEDYICCGSIGLKNVTKSGSKRCSGQGDILCGLIATFLVLGHQEMEENISNVKKLVKTVSNACILMRKSSLAAFNIHHHGLIGSDILNFIQESLLSF